MKISKVISTIITGGRNIVKVLRLGNSDVQTGYNIQPFGIDGNIPSGYRCIFADTGNRGEKIIIGIINTNALAGIGELRLHSENNGSESFYIWIKNNGTCELGGNSDNAVRYSKLYNAMDKLKTDINAELTKIQTGITGVGGAYAKVDISIDISEAKINEIKTT
jgi:hypothetical protein